MNTNEFVTKTVKAEDYEERSTFEDMFYVCESVKLLVGYKVLQVVKSKENGNLYFILDDGIDNQVSPFVMAKEDNGKITIYELSYKAYCKYGF